MRAKVSFKSSSAATITSESGAGGLDKATSTLGFAISANPQRLCDLEFGWLGFAKPSKAEPRIRLSIRHHQTCDHFSHHRSVLEAMP